jgi:hypothetical protein
VNATWRNAKAPEQKQQSDRKRKVSNENRNPNKRARQPSGDVKLALKSLLDAQRHLFTPLTLEVTGANPRSG